MEFTRIQRLTGYRNKLMEKKEIYVIETCVIKPEAVS